MFDKLSKTIFIITFFSILLIPLLCTNLKPNSVSEIENRNLNNFPKFCGFNENYISDFEAWFNDNIGLREFLFKANSKIQFEIFNNSSIEKVVVGREGWLFYTGENNIGIATGEYPNWGEDELQDICQKQMEIKNRLAKQNIEYVLFLPPSKVSIYPEYLRGDFAVTQTPVDILADYLEEHTDIKVVKIKPTLLKEKENTDNLLYFKTDSHWNGYGCYIGYHEVIDKLNAWNIIDSAPAKVDFIQASRMCDLTAMMVDNDKKYYENNTSTYYEVLSSTATQVMKGEKYNKIQKYVSDKAIRRGDYFENVNKDMASFLVFGDSMFMDWLEPLMAENCSDLTCIWSYDITQEAIDMVQPDVVLFEMTERALNSLGYHSHEFIS